MKPGTRSKQPKQRYELQAWLAEQGSKEGANDTHRVPASKWSVTDEESDFEHRLGGDSSMDGLGHYALAHARAGRRLCRRRCWRRRVRELRVAGEHGFAADEIVDHATDAVG